MKKIILKSALAALAFTLLSIGIFLLNFFLDKAILNLSQILKNSIFIQTSLLTFIKIFLLYLFLYFGLAFFCLLVAKIIKQKYHKKISGLAIFIILILLLTIRSIIVEPFLYQVFYDASAFFRAIMNALLYFDLKLALDGLLLFLFGAGLWLLLRQYGILLAALFLFFSFLYQNPIILNQPRETENQKTIIFIIADSLRKDAITADKNLFLNKLKEMSLSVENMYTVFPASVPTLASIFTNDYPYKFNATALSLDNQINLNFIKELKKNIYYPFTQTILMTM